MLIHNHVHDRRRSTSRRDEDELYGGGRDEEPHKSPRFGIITCSCVSVVCVCFASTSEALVCCGSAGVQRVICCSLPDYLQLLLRV